MRHPTKEELDAVSKDVPILIIHQSSHLATVNSAMLKEMGYDASSKDPAGGVIQRKPGTTEPNGTLEETAFFAARPVVIGRVGPEGLKTSRARVPSSGRVSATPPPRKAVPRRRWPTS